MRNFATSSFGDIERKEGDIRLLLLLVAHELNSRLSAEYAVSGELPKVSSYQAFLLGLLCTLLMFSGYPYALYLRYFSVIRLFVFDNLIQCALKGFVYILA